MMPRTNRLRYSLLPLVGFSIALAGGCKKTKEDTSTNSPMISEEDESILPTPSGDGEVSSEGELDIDEEAIAEEEDGRWDKPLAELPPRSEPRKKCRGRGKRRKCKMLDPKPGISASHGAREFMGPYRFGMSPESVIRRLSKDINASYEEKIKGVDDPTVQDRHRKWRREQVDKIRANHIKFEGQNHRWKASIVQHDFEDDANEEMIWHPEGEVKTFFFFKDNELWKIVRAYDPRVFDGKPFDAVMEESWKKKFGSSPKDQKIKDTRSTDVLLSYTEWQSSENGTIRAFDLSPVQGAYVLAVMDRGVEGRIGKRLPNMERSQGKVGSSVDGAVKDVAGGSDVCYDDDGNMIESRTRCKEIRGF